MSRKHNRTYNPIKARQQHIARQKRINRTYLVMDVVVLVSLIHSVKAIIGGVSKVRSARKSSLEQALAMTGEERITGTVRSLQVAKFERNNARGIKARYAAHRSYRAAFRAAVAEGELIKAAQVASGAQAQYQDAFGKHVHARYTVAEKRAERKMRKAAKAETKANNSSDSHLSSVS